MKKETRSQVVERLVRAAQVEGLLIFNPEIDSQQALTDWITHI